MRFEELNLSNGLISALKDLNYFETTLIQEKAIPKIMEGKDVIGQSMTGTGKTAAYSLPIINRINSLENIKALILCPTRELTLQVTEEIKKFSKYLENINAISIYGGEDIEKQIKELKNKVNIVIGTPGRVYDHIERETIDLSKVETVVIDEADEMLNIGFEEDIERIINKLPKERQTILFSATLNDRIFKLTEKYMKSPENIRINSENLTVDNVKQYSIEVYQKMKDEVLARILDINSDKKCMVFCNTKNKIDDLIEKLKEKGYKASCIYSDMKQVKREKIMQTFREHKTQVLIATDVVARGIDIDDVDVVINYDIPLENEYYVHRIGRTGRNGKDGKAYTFVVGKEKEKLAEIEKYAKTKLLSAEIPSDKEIKKIRCENILKKVQNSINNNNYMQNYALNEIYEKIKSQNLDEERLIKGLLNMAVGKETYTTNLDSFLKYSENNQTSDEQSYLLRKYMRNDGFKKAKKYEFGG